MKTPTTEQISKVAPTAFSINKVIVDAPDAGPEVGSGIAGQNVNKKEEMQAPETQGHSPFPTLQEPTETAGEEKKETERGRIES